jgi:RHS repeat-associated protein
MPVFTGYERDAESGLYNAQARYNYSALGRFMSPDPSGITFVHPTNPQSWNMYTYVMNKCRVAGACARCGSSPF